MKLVCVDDVAPAPWKNGGGVTRELLRVPGDGGSDWLLRISVADIGADGPFSPFPGVTRLFAVLEGAGVRLSWPDGRPDLDMTPDSPPLRFDGALAPGCTLRGGPTRDLNVMLRGDGRRVTMAPVGTDEEHWLGHATAFGFFTLRAARVHGPGTQALELPAGTLVWCTAQESARPMWWVAAADGAPAHDPAPAAYAIWLGAAPDPEA